MYEAESLNNKCYCVLTCIVSSGFRESSVALLYLLYIALCLKYTFYSNSCCPFEKRTFMFRIQYRINSDGWQGELRPVLLSKHFDEYTACQPAPKSKF